MKELTTEDCFNTLDKFQTKYNWYLKRLTMEESFLERAGYLTLYLEYYFKHMYKLSDLPPLLQEKLLDMAVDLVCQWSLLKTEKKLRKTRQRVHRTHLR